MSDELTAADLEGLAWTEAPHLTKAILASLVRLRAAHPGVELGGF